MDTTFTYLETESTDPYYNLAFEEYVLTHYLTGTFLILWQNDNTIVIGLNQNTAAEINRPFVEEHKINVVRRSTGGGAVYHDLGNLNYSFITDLTDADVITKARFTDPIVTALSNLGIHAEASGRNDILADGKKVSGTAERVYKNRILHHGTLLFDANSEMVSGALHVDPAKFESKGVKSVRSRIGNIRPLLKEDMTLQQFWQYLIDALTGGVLARATLPGEALSEIQTLRDEKYATWEWNFGRSPAYNYHAKERFSGGSLEVFAGMKNGSIDTIRFCGDFLALSPMDDLITALCGCPFRKDTVDEVLSRFPLEQYFGAITKGEILSVLF